MSIWVVQSCHMESSSDGSSTRRRAPRQRASRSSIRASRETTTRKVVSRRPAPKPVEKVERVAPPERKAPTPIASTKASRMKRRKQLITAFVVLVIGIGISAVVGFTDKGQIDVQKTIQERNERIRTNTTDERDANTQLIEVPVQNTNIKPKEGLVGAGKAKAPAPAPVPVVTSSTTASTTDTVASTTEDIIEEDLVDETGS